MAENEIDLFDVSSTDFVPDKPTKKVIIATMIDVIVIIRYLTTAFKTLFSNPFHQILQK